MPSTYHGRGRLLFFVGRLLRSINLFVLCQSTLLSMHLTDGLQRPLTTLVLDAALDRRPHLRGEGRLSS
jgi:hypothetical protein